MKRLFTLAMVALVVVGIPAMGADKKPGQKKKKKKEAVEAPKFPEQPYLNAGLKALAEAQYAFKNSSNSEEVVKKLQVTLEKLGPMKKKGGYVEDCRRNAESAIKHLQSGETDKAAEDIDKSMKAGIRAGEVGDRLKQ